MIFFSQAATPPTSSTSHAYTRNTPQKLLRIYNWLYLQEADKEFIITGTFWWNYRKMVIHLPKDSREIAELPARRNKHLCTPVDFTRTKGFSRKHSVIPQSHNPAQEFHISYSTAIPSRYPHKSSGQCVQKATHHLHLAYFPVHSENK